HIDNGAADGATENYQWRINVLYATIYLHISTEFAWYR
ncbi:hypothetical protein SEEN0624_03133, partial [Salmonella enterica subsp. enterica serovar Newport str. PRS_2010_0624]